jgi:hypothetical protein
MASTLTFSAALTEPAATRVASRPIQLCVLSPTTTSLLPAESRSSDSASSRSRISSPGETPVAQPGGDVLDRAWIADRLRDLLGGIALARRRERNLPTADRCVEDLRDCRRRDGHGRSGRGVARFWVEALGPRIAGDDQPLSGRQHQPPARRRRRAPLATRLGPPPLTPPPSDSPGERRGPVMSAAGWWTVTHER